MTTKKKTDPDEAPEVEEDSAPDGATEDADEEAAEAATVAKDRGRSKADAAKRLGMKESEIAELREVDDGTLVITHDGFPTLWREDDSLEFGYGRG